MVSIAGINIETPLALAPMAGVTDVAFRTICREQGAGLTCTEMVSAKALCYQDKKTVPLLQLLRFMKSMSIVSQGISLLN